MTMSREDLLATMATIQACRELDAELRRADDAYADAKKSIRIRRLEQQRKCLHLCVTRATAETAPQCEICGAEV